MIQGCKTGEKIGDVCFVDHRKGLKGFISDTTVLMESSGPKGKFKLISDRFGWKIQGTGRKYAVRQGAMEDAREDLIKLASGKEIKFWVKEL